jgi:integration host factor subunit beta
VFEVKKRKAKQARNPRTGAKVQVPERFVVKFKPGQEMTERVAQLTNVPSRGAVAATPSEGAD